MDFLNALNANTYMAAFSMLLMNLGSKYIALDISKAQDKLLKNHLVRRITLFCIFYVATRNILISIALTVLFVVINSTLLHEESMFCLLPHSIRKVDSHVTKDEYENAKKIIDAYDKAHAEGAEKAIPDVPKPVLASPVSNTGFFPKSQHQAIDEYQPWAAY